MRLKAAVLFWRGKKSEAAEIYVKMAEFEPENDQKIVILNNAIKICLQSGDFTFCLEIGNIREDCIINQETGNLGVSDDFYQPLTDGYFKSLALGPRK